MGLQSPACVTLFSDEPSLLVISGGLLDRVGSILTRLEQINDKLHGAHPRGTATSGSVNAPEPPPAIRLTLGRAHRVLDDVYTELDEIEKGL